VLGGRDRVARGRLCGRRSRKEGWDEDQGGCSRPSLRHADQVGRSPAMRLRGGMRGGLKSLRRVARHSGEDMDRMDP